MNTNILKLLLNREVNSRYNQLVKDNSESKELKILCSCIEQLHEEYPEQQNFSVTDLDVMLSKAYPSLSRIVIDPILENLKNADINPDLLAEYLADFSLRIKAKEIAVKALYVFETGEGISELETVVSELGSVNETGTDADDEFVTTNVIDLCTELESTPGLEWRLKCLNEMMGPLRLGTFMFVFARPETGKTTFLASEVSYMMEQMDRPVLWVNNEEESKKVTQRVIQAALGCTREQLLANQDRANTVFHDKHNGHLFRINKEAQTTKRGIEKWCKDLNPGLIILDQIDKIEGFEGERYDLKMKSIYAWARELGKRYGPVIAVCQAGGTADNKKWLTMNDVDSSHTAKQGEADAILGIGKLYDEQYEMVRFLHLSKNKLTGKHGKKEVLIKAETARYVDMGG